MFGSVKKKILGQQQLSSPLSDPAPHPHPQRRPPSTPPLPLRTLQLVAKQPEIPVVLRNRWKVKGHGSGVRETWPNTRQTLLSGAQPITEVQVRGSDQSQPCMSPSATPPPAVHNSLLSAAPHTHWSVPVRAPPNGRGSDATMMSLLLFCHSTSSNSLNAIDNKIEQAMDLVKSHLMLAVREEVELLREQIRELQEKNQHLERENHILRTLTHNIHTTQHDTH